MPISLFTRVIDDAGVTVGKGAGRRGSVTGRASAALDWRSRLM